MRPRSQILRVCLSFVLTFFPLNVSNSSAQLNQKDLPNIGDLKAAAYKETSRPELGGALDHSDLQKILGMCRAYARSASLLPKFHEPVLTRGTTGISIFRTVSPSVVLVLTGNFRGEELSELGIGTGAIVDPAGYVLTNWHVIAGYESAVIFLKPVVGTEILGTNAYAARLIAQDPTTDLALLKIEKPPSGLRSIPVADSLSLQVAEDIHVIGHPQGKLWSYSTGVISQIRDNFNWTYADGSKHTSKVLQMQTAINPGNSGGPVLDDKGKMLGLVAMSEEGQNLNYAVAGDVIKTFVSRASGLRTRGGPSGLRNPQGDHAHADLAHGKQVIKSVYPDLTKYKILDRKGNSVGLIVEFADGSLLQAWGPNSFGGFHSWSATLPDESRVKALGDSLIPDTFFRQ